MTMPTFLIIGAAKSGTTSLHYYLKQHPEIFVSPIKQTNFFALEGQKPDFRGPAARYINDTSVTDRAQYESLFDGATTEKAIGEASPTYMTHPHACGRIKQHLPDAKLIALLRNPIDRAYSAYMMKVRDGLEPARDFREAVRDEARRDRERWASTGYVWKGFYYAQLKPYFGLFPRDQIRVYLFEEFTTQLQAVLRDIFQFLGVDDRFEPNLSTNHNASGVIRNPILRTLWTRSNSVRSTLRPLLPESVRHRLFQFVTRNLVKQQLPSDLRAELITTFREDVLKLQELLGRDLQHWLTMPETNQTGVKHAA